MTALSRSSLPTDQVVSSLLEIHLAHTQGFCAGVSSAIEIVELALAKYGTPLYVRHHIVHNTSVIQNFESQGVVFIESLDEVPDHQHVIFSAHGTAPGVYNEAKARHLHVIDATCPLVTKVHRQAVKFSEQGVQTVLIGHRGHQELIGTSGYVDQSLLSIVETEADVEMLNLDETRPVGYITQTTLSISETEGIIRRLKARYPHLQGPPKSNICYATQNRQDAVLELAEVCDVIIICGSPNSSNSNRLREAAAARGVPSYIVDSVSELKLDWLNGKQKLGISSGASVPSYIVDSLVETIQGYFPGVALFREETKEVGIKFSIPAI